jgi:hypothetical protein
MDPTLNNLKKSWQVITEAEKETPSFCYMVRLDPDEEKLFIELQKHLKLSGELIESGDFHATIRYVKSDKSYEPFIKYLKTLDMPALTAECVGFAVYGKEKDTLVIELDGPELHDWFSKINKWLIDNGYPKSDFPTYKPHISLTEKIGIDKPEWSNVYKRKVTFRLHVVSDTDHNDVYKEVS